jgi:hypothetical protein
VPAYTLNEDAVRHAKRLIDARQYVLRSRWQNVQPRAREQNAFLKTHPWEEYAAWHLGLTEGAAEETKARYAFVYGDFRLCCDRTSRMRTSCTRRKSRGPASASRIATSARVERTAAWSSGTEPGRARGGARPRAASASTASPRARRSRSNPARKGVAGSAYPQSADSADASAARRPRRLPSRSCTSHLGLCSARLRHEYWRPSKLEPSDRALLARCRRTRAVPGRRQRRSVAVNPG